MVSRPCRRRRTSSLDDGGNLGVVVERRGTLLYRQGGRRDIYTPIIEEETKRLEGEIGVLVADVIRKAIK